MAFDTSTAEGLSTHRSSSRPTPDAIKPRLFPTTLSTTVFSQCTCGRFEASPRRAAPEGQTTSITSTAPQSAEPPSTNPSCLLRSRSQPLQTGLSRRFPYAYAAATGSVYVVWIGALWIG